MTIDEQVWDILIKLPDVPIKVSVINQLLGAKDEESQHAIRWALKRLSDSGRFNRTTDFKIWHVDAYG